MDKTRQNNPNRLGATTVTYPARRTLLACLAGVMLTASFPPWDLSFLAWFSLIPLYKAIEDQSLANAFRLGIVSGMAHYLTLIYWIMTVLQRYGGLNFYMSLAPFILLSLYLSLFLALFSCLITILRTSRFPIILSACFWVGLEYARANLMTGFPWCLLGYTQYRHLPLIQVADISGVYGLSFLIVIINGFVYSLFSKQQPERRHLKWEIPVIGLIVGSVLVYGYYRLSWEDGKRRASSRDIKVLVVQGNIDQSVKWNPAYQQDTIATYLRLTRAGYGLKPDLIVWPETSVPFFLQDNGPLAKKVLDVAAESGATFIFGSPAYTQNNALTRYYNRACLVSSDGQTIQYYDKTHLVPFGEYIPLKKILFFIDRLVPAAGDFEVGKKICPLTDKNHSFGIFICFEAIFPEIARALTKKGANILINITNDAWFGKTSAPYQHLSMAVFRAVENKRPMIRAANTGFSAIILPQGSIIARSKLFTEEIIKKSFKISDETVTFYTRFGDLFAAFLSAISLLKIIFSFRHMIAS